MEDAPRAADRPATRLVLPAISLGMVLAPLNSTMIAVALPAIQDAFGVSLAATTWLVALYLVAMAVVQPIGGRLGDLYGRRRMYLLGLGWFAAASVGCAFAPSLPWLVVFRTQQAIAGAVSLPSGVALVRESIPEARRGRAFGIVGMVTGTAAAAGPPLGGLLVHLWGWQAIFWTNVPIILAAVPLALVGLPVEDAPARRSGRFDWPGSLLMAMTLGSVVLVPTFLRRGGVSRVAVLLAVAVVAGMLFARRETRIARPVVDLTMFRHRHYAFACMSILLGNFVMYTTLLALPLFLERVRGHNAQVSGLVLASLSVFSAFLGPLGGRWADQRGAWWPAVTGGAALATGALLLTASTRLTGLAPLIVALMVMGLGLGIAGAPVQASAVEAVPREQTGSAAGVFSTFRYVGSVTGSTILALSLSGEVGAGDSRAFTLLFAGLTLAAVVGIAANAGVATRGAPGGESRPALPILPGGTSPARSRTVSVSLPGRGPRRGDAGR